jgi:HPt (histidine-containing phosphotransfer) domain-containing protein
METFDIAAEEFVAEFENNMNKIKTAKEASDMANYAIETHGLKSNARYMGFEELGDMSYEHELAGKDNNVEFVNANYDKLMAEANRVNEVLKNYMAN